VTGMATDNSNDNNGARRLRPQANADAHGQAALLLVESLIHGLIARSMISVSEAVEIVEVAVEVNAELALDRSDEEEGLDHSLQLLGAISESLRRDIEVT
jgi:hypothetical protein